MAQGLFDMVLIEPMTSDGDDEEVQQNNFIQLKNVDLTEKPVDFQVQGVDPSTKKKRVLRRGRKLRRRTSRKTESVTEDQPEVPDPLRIVQEDILEVEMEVAVGVGVVDARETVQNLASAVVVSDNTENSATKEQSAVVSNNKVNTASKESSVSQTNDLSMQLILTPGLVQRIAKTIEQYHDKPQSNDTQLINKHSGSFRRDVTPQKKNAEMIQIINDGTGFIQNTFRLILRGITNSKLQLTKKECERGKKDIKDEEDEEEEEEEEDEVDMNAELMQSHKTVGNLRDLMGMVDLMGQLDFFIDVMCGLNGGSSSKDTYSIIVLYEKLVGDLKAEISSLSQRLSVYETISGRKS